MKWTMVPPGIVSLIGASLSGAEENKTEVIADHISFFTVPLRCEAAPEIGCGSLSKPILLELQREPIIAEAWLNGTGTVMAVVWVVNSSHEARAKAIRTVLEKNGLTVTELDGEARDNELKSFVSRDAWYHGTDVDKLTKQEARIIATRLVHRLQAKISLSAEKAEALEAGWADVVARCFIDSPDNSTVTHERGLSEQLLKVARENLDQSEIGAFEEAIAKGLRRVAGDKEETKSGTPNCCSLKSTTKS
jgi:hypothetical protein